MDEEIKEWLAHFQKDIVQDIVHQFHIIAEEGMDRVKILAEGLADLTEKVDRKTDELNNKIDNVQATLERKYILLDKKIDNVQIALDKKIDRTNRELKGLRTDVLRIENKVVEKVKVVATRLDEHERVIHHL